LAQLDLSGTGLTSLPPEIGHLTQLRQLNLNGTGLTSLPPEIGHLTQLAQLDLRETRLTTLPLELRQLAYLRNIELDDMPHLLSPPAEVVARDTQAVLTFLRELADACVVRYEAKLLVVGEGGTGKTSLLRALRAEDFREVMESTHGIEVGELRLPHPESGLPDLTLRTWDFGGQHIYHATHQFFLTRRSVYLVAWNARLGAEQGRLHYWLDTIKTLAPEAPVLLVATHIDERAPDLNYAQYQGAYPQLAGQVSLSNKTGEGAVELGRALATQAARLPQMGQPWPTSWVAVEQALEARPEHHVGAEAYLACCEEHEVDAEIAQGTLGNYLHDLGKILYFRDDYLLANLVVLKPNWVTKAISRVLTDEPTRAAGGILRHSKLPGIWATDEEGHAYAPHLYPIFLRLMERFDLSYQVEAPAPNAAAEYSLIPQLLPHQPPANLPPWPATPPADQAQVEMIYRLAVVPAGIMSWFIVRTHRYTEGLHWREGTLLAYEGHEARVELNPLLRTVQMTVRGTAPYNFFTILMKTLDLILDRFPGLDVVREVPCICHVQRQAAQPCGRAYRYEDLVRRVQAGKRTVECPETFAEVSLLDLLYGIHASTSEQVMQDIARGQAQLQVQVQTGFATQAQANAALLEKVNQQSELIARQFLWQWNLEQRRLEAECPNTFLLLPGAGRGFNPRNWISQEYELWLMCQHPPGPHVVGQAYQVRESEKWWVAVSPWLRYLLRFLEYGVPLGKALGGVLVDDAVFKQPKADLELLDAIVKHLPEMAQERGLPAGTGDPAGEVGQESAGPALRALFQFLDKADPAHAWGGLERIVTPDGTILWLCATHRQAYQARLVPLSAMLPGGRALPPGS
jgi:internalin A